MSFVYPVVFFSLWLKFNRMYINLVDLIRSWVLWNENYVKSSFLVRLKRLQITVRQHLWKGLFVVITNKRLARQIEEFRLSTRSIFIIKKTERLIKVKVNSYLYRFVCVDFDWKLYFSITQNILNTTGLIN